MNSWQTKEGFSLPDKKLKIYYSLEALGKTFRLVQAHKTEIAWNMVVKPFKDGYKVYDIFVYPQAPDPGYVSVDVANAYTFWKANLDPEVDRNLFGQGHSHVDMNVFVSGTDDRNQYEEIMLKGNGFYFFQIWNKRNEVISFFYDIDNMIYYDNKDIELIPENLNEFIEDSFNKIYSKQEEEQVESEQIV